jgi:hypothetical protein
VTAATGTPESACQPTHRNYLAALDQGEDSDMNRIAQELDEKLRTLDPPRAKYLESLVREALGRAERAELGDSGSGWPAGYFDQTAGALSGEHFERPPQGELPCRDNW